MGSTPPERRPGGGVPANLTPPGRSAGPLGSQTSWEPAGAHPAGPPANPSELSPLRRAERVYLELRTLLYEALKRRRTVGLRRGLKVDLRVEIDLLEESETRVGSARRFAEALLARIGQAVDEEIGRAAPFPAGRVRCYWCDSFDCVHAGPPAPHAVFGGYSPTGIPLWPDLAQVALERHDPRIEGLYLDVPVPLVMLDRGTALVSAQLPVYGQRSGVYHILGQVAVGYLSLPVGPRSERAGVALSIQAVEVERGRPRVHLNVIGRLPDGTDLVRFLEEEPDSRLADALRVTRARLSEIAPKRGGGESRERQALAILGKLARTLDRMFRQQARRTKHAQDRHLDRERPAAAALRDAMSARPEEIYRDVRESTWVVVGPRSRVHIFNDLGQHVTSVVYPGETVRRRTAQGKWRAAPPDSVRGFREAVERSSGSTESASDSL